MSGATVWLISGANRGIGLAIVTHLASTEANTIVYAGTRDVESSVELQALARAHPDVVRPIRLLSADPTTNAAAAARIAEETGHLDYVLANAGIGGQLKPISELSLDHFQDCFTVNTLGPIALFQATYSLLQKGTAKKFCVITSRGGSITECLPLNFGAYGVSKSAANYLTQKLGGELESEGFVVLALSPGFVQTEMSLKTIRKIGMENWKTADGAATGRFRPISPQESAEGLVQVMKSADRERARSFLNWDGTTTPW